MTKVEREEHKAWLASLKEGDAVAAIHVKTNGVRIGKVEHVFFDDLSIDFGERWNTRFKKSNGRLRYPKEHGPQMLVPATPEMLAKDAHAKKVAAARSRLWSIGNTRDISDAKALRIVAILDEPEATT